MAPFPTLIPFPFNWSLGSHYVGAEDIQTDEMLLAGKPNFPSPLRL
jgi:hypothetical protein